MSDSTAAAGPVALTELADEMLMARVQAIGGKPFQARQLAHWIYKHGAQAYDDCKNVPKRLREALAADTPIRSSTVETVDASADGTEKLLIRLHDAETVECVLIPEAPRMTLCISTQVGCPVGCIFCASGLAGVRRNLTAGEIVEQVLHASDRLAPEQPLTNLVVMGLGEPMLNLDALVAALERIHDPDGINLGARRITVSTSGYPRQMEQFAAATEHPFNLAVSLHAADDELRKRLVPTATAPVEDILAAARRYAQGTRREVTYEVVLLDSINDRPQDADALIDRLEGDACTVNLIPWNPVDQIPDLARPAPMRVDAFADHLRAGGLNVTVRRQRGADRSAACGQLRLRNASDPVGPSP